MARPVVLIIRDGWGIRDEIEGNAVKLARTPNLTRYWRDYPHCQLFAHGEHVGLPEGSQGSSEVGHLNMGAGRVVKQEVVRVDELVRSGGLATHPRVTDALAFAAARGGRVHLMGLVQDQGVHATERHMFAFVRALAGLGVRDVFIHFFSDGRDTPPRSALTYLDRLEETLRSVGVGRVASVMGRYYAMDRDRNWERTRRAYDALVHGEGRSAASAREAIEQAYGRADRHPEGEGGQPPETDEFIAPTLIGGEGPGFDGCIRPGDAVFHMNYRQDRAIQLTQAFVDPEQCGQEFSGIAPMDIAYRGLTRYYDAFDGFIVPPMDMANLLGERVGQAGLWQLRISETQKFKHVTSFFNGKRELPFDREDRILVDSPKVPEQDKPEMSAPEVTELAVLALREGIAAARAATQERRNAHLTAAEGLEPGRGRETYDLLVMNYANCDMVGHTGVIDAAVAAVEEVDRGVGRVVEAALALGGVILITADHGNAEQMIDPETGGVQTAHTLNPVECILVGPDAEVAGTALHGPGVLADVGVTVMSLLGLPIPQQMDGRDLRV